MKPPKMKSRVRKIFNELFSNYPDLKQCREDVEASFALLARCYKKRGKVLLCGNGGSASDAEHIACELMKEFMLKREVTREDARKICKVDPENSEFLCEGLQRALPAISLVSQTALFSAFANDVNIDMVFAQQVYGYGRDNDVLWAISTSGNSPNICNAARIAKAMGLNVIGLTGKTGGTLALYCNVAIRAPSEITYRIQEYHKPIYHILCAMLEEEFFGV